MNNIPEYNVFICHDRESDGIYKDQLIGMDEWDDVSSDWVGVFSGSLSFEDAADGSAAEGVVGTAERISENRICEADVLILLCGENTKGDRLTNSEINAAMQGGAKSGLVGILALNLPTIEGRQCGISIEGENAYVEDRRGGRRLLGEMTRKEIEEAFPFLPDIIIENLKKYICIPIVDWSDVCDDPARLRGLIDVAAHCPESGD